MTLSRAVTVLDTMPGEKIHERMFAAQLTAAGFVSFGGAWYHIEDFDRLIAAGVWRWFLREVVHVAAA